MSLSKTKNEGKFAQNGKYIPLFCLAISLNLGLEMKLSKESIEEIKSLYYKEFGERVSDELAQEIGERLLSLFKVIYRPLPKGGRQDLSEGSPIP